MRIPNKEPPKDLGPVVANLDTGPGGRDNLGVTSRDVVEQPPGLDISQPIDLGPAPESIDLGPAVTDPTEDERKAAWAGALEGSKKANDDAAVARVKLVLDAAHSAPADASDLDLATRTGLPIDTVQAGRETLRSALAEKDPAAFRSKYPTFTDHILANPDTARALVHDPALPESEAAVRAFDPEMMPGQTALEDQYRASHKSTGGVLLDSLKVGYYQTQIGYIARKQRDGTATQADLDLADSLEAQADQIKKSYSGASGPLEMIATASGEQLPRMGVSMTKWGSIGFTLGTLAGLATPGGVGVVPMAGLGTSAGILLGGLFDAGQDEGAGFYRDMIKQGIDPAEAKAASYWVDAVNGSLEAIPMEKVLRVIPGLKKAAGIEFKDWLSRAITSPTVKAALARSAGRMAEGSVFEGVTEGLQEVAPIFFEERLKGKSTGEAFAALSPWHTTGVDPETGEQTTQWARYWESIKGGALAAVGMHAASPYVHAEIAKELHEAQTVQIHAKQYTQFGNVLAKSSTFKDAPEAARAWVKKMQEANLVPENVSVPAADLKREIDAAGINVEEVLPDVARQLKDAEGREGKDGKAEVVIPMADLAVTVGPKSVANLAADIRRVDVENGQVVREYPTAREAPEIEAQVKKEMADAAKKQAEVQAESEKNGGASPADSRAYVFEGIRKHFDEIYTDEQMPAHAKTQNAALWAAFAASRAERTGVTPAEYFRSKGGLSIFAPVRNWGDLTKTEQKGALAQDSDAATFKRIADEAKAASETPEAQATRDAAMNTPSETGFVQYRPGEAPRAVQQMTPEEEAAFRAQEKARRAESAKAADEAKAASINPADYTAHRPEASPAGDLSPEAGKLLPKVDSGVKPDLAPTRSVAEQAGIKSPVEPSPLTFPLPTKTAREVYPLLWNSEYEAQNPGYGNWDRLVNTAIQEPNTDPTVERAVEATKDMADAVERTDKLVWAGKKPELPEGSGPGQRRFFPAYLFPDGKVVVTPGGHAGIFDNFRQVAKDAGIDPMEIGNLFETATDTYEKGKPLHGYVLIDGGKTYVLDYGGGQALRDKVDLNAQFQKSGDNVRGFFQTDPARTFFRITLTGKANLSTFVHESGHAFLAMLEADAMAGDQSAAADLQVVRDWLGSKGKTKWTREQLETFARGFEAYMWEGKAPSSQLRGVFDAVMSWMRHIYATVTRLNVDLSPEIRGVMDRMLATDAEIEQAKRENGFMPPVEKADLAGMTEEEYAKIKEGFDKAAEAATNRATRDSLRQSRWALEDQYVAHRATAEREAAEVPALKVRDLLDGKFQIDTTLSNGEYNRTKLDRAWVKANFPEMSPQEKKRLAPFLTKQGERGVNPDLAAGLLATHGIDAYADGRALVGDLLATPPKEVWVSQRADQMMAEKYPGYQHSKVWEQANAQRALHEDQVGNAVWAGFVAFAKIPKGEARSIQMAIREAASRRVSDMKVLELTATARWLRDERQAAQEVAEAWKAKDTQAAYDATRRQLMAMYTWQEAEAAARRVEDIRRFLRPFQQDKTTRGRIAKGDPNALTVIDGVLAQVGLSGAPKGVVVEALAAAERLRAANPDAVISPEILRFLQNYKAMTLSDLESVYATVKNVAHVATDALTEKKAQDGKAWADYVGDLVDHIRNGPPSTRPPATSDYGLDPTRRSAYKTDAALRKIEFILREADNGQTAGKLHMAIFKKIADCEAREHTMFKQLNDELGKLRGTLSTSERWQHDQKHDFLGKQMALRDVLTVALNLRNPGNTERMLKSEGWEISAVTKRLDELLSDKDIELVNRFGALVESYWPDIAEVHTRVHGVPPRKVEGKPFTLPSGRVIEGGYYPIIKDPNRSSVQEDIRVGEKDLWENDIIPPVVGSEFTKERADTASTPMRLSLDALPHHLVRVIHYITHYEATRQVDKLITNSQFKSALEAKIGREKVAELRPWLQAVVDDKESRYDSLGMIENVLRSSRMGASVVLLGGKVAVAITQGLGLSVTAKELGRASDGSPFPSAGRAGKYIAHGVREYLRDWAQMMKDPLHRSVYDRIISQDESFVLHRENYDRDLRASYRQLTSVFSTFGHAKHSLATFSMALFNSVQGFVNAVTWYGAMKKAEDEGHADPVAYAASVVRMSQASGGPKDLSRFQRGDEFRKLMTVMFSYRNLVYNQIMEDGPQERSVPARAAIKAAQFWYVVMVPAIVTAMLRADWGNDDDDLASRVAMDATAYSLGTIPVAGELANASASILDPDGKMQDAFRPSPWLRAFADVSKSLVQTAATDHEWSDRDTENAITAAGTMTAMPAGALNNALNFMSKLDGMEDPGMNFFFRNRKDWR